VTCENLPAHRAARFALEEFWHDARRSAARACTLTACGGRVDGSVAFHVHFVPTVVSRCSLIALHGGIDG
jgi:hypothetical protein